PPPPVKSSELTWRTHPQRPLKTLVLSQRPSARGPCLPGFSIPIPSPTGLRQLNLTLPHSADSSARCLTPASISRLRNLKRRSSAQLTQKTTFQRLSMLLALRSPNKGCADHG